MRSSSEGVRCQWLGCGVRVAACGGEARLCHLLVALTGQRRARRFRASRS